MNYENSLKGEPTFLRVLELTMSPFEESEVQQMNVGLDGGGRNRQSPIRFVIMP
jgi:hypothetical protein